VRRTAPLLRALKVVVRDLHCASLCRNTLRVCVGFEDHELGSAEVGRVIEALPIIETLQLRFRRVDGGCERGGQLQRIQLVAAVLLLLGDLHQHLQVAVHLAIVPSSRRNTPLRQSQAWMML